uniref:non-specific serine/threonine protein kinase n=1 Tax=Strigamia maritima TaxID=126957 RepID=T1ISF8_STRMM
MSFRAATNLVFRYGRKIVCEVLFGRVEQTNPFSSRIAHNYLIRAAQDVKNEKGLFGGLADAVWKQKLDGKTPFFAQKFIQWLTNSPAAELRRNAAKKLMYGGRQLTPYLGFVGINLISGQGIITKKDELEGICEEIRVCADLLNRQKESTIYETASSLTDLQIGSVIAKGCNAIVHCAKWKNQEIENDEVMEKYSGRFGDYDLAVKMMFNYEAESNATTILKCMSRETVPAKKIEIGDEIDLWNYNCKFGSKWLPPHLNVVDMICAFVDTVPFLPDALNLYPNALPRRLNEDGLGRNMTLFLVMKRYDTSLKEYLTSHTPSPTTRILLLLQLFEGINHLVRFNIAHRDLKTDNILLDLSEGLDCPHLVITDFGCCLAQENSNLKLHYVCDDIELGGNCALMAPEVASAKPSSFTVINYNRADLWTAGTLAYEIYGESNPFYGNKAKNRLETRTYQESNLPASPTLMPDAISKLVKSILRRNPKERPSPSVAANVCHLLLWGPQSVLSGEKTISSKVVLEWMVMEAAITLCQGINEVESLFAQIRNSFLSRVKMSEVEESLDYF